MEALLALANWSTLLVCMVLKLPQVVAVGAAGSARGLSLQSLVLELSGFLVFLRYQSYYSYPLETYLEYPILIAQDVILLLFVLHYSGNMKQALPYVVIFIHVDSSVDFNRTVNVFKSFRGVAKFVGGWYFLTFQKWVIDLAMNLCTLISAASKFAQLRCLWQTRDSGQVSALTWSMSTYTCAARIVTTLMTTNDPMVLVRFIIMLVLNIWVTATILRYRKTEKTD